MAGLTTAATTLPERLVRVVVGPANGTGIEFVDEDLTFSIKSTRGSKPNEAEVVISNLSRATIETHLEIDGVQADDLTLQIYAGETAAGLLFRGDVARRGIETKNDTPERTTTIRAADGRRVWRDARFSASWPPGTGVAAAFQALIAASSLKAGYVSALPVGTFAGSWHFVGKWSKALTELAAAYGYDWWIDQGALFLVAGADDPSRGNAALISPSTGLIGSPRTTAKGADFETLLDPRLRPGFPVVLESDFFDGLYRAFNVVHTGATEARQWKTACQAELVK